MKKLLICLLLGLTLTGCGKEEVYTPPTPDPSYEEEFPVVEELPEQDYEFEVIYEEKIDVDYPVDAYTDAEYVELIKQLRNDAFSKEEKRVILHEFLEDKHRVNICMVNDYVQGDITKETFYNYFMQQYTACMEYLDFGGPDLDEDTWIKYNSTYDNYRNKIGMMLNEEEHSELMLWVENLQEVLETHGMSDEEYNDYMDYKDLIKYGEIYD